MLTHEKGDLLDTKIRCLFDTMTSLTDDLCAVIDSNGIVHLLDKKLKQALNIEDPVECHGKRLGDIIHCARIHDYHGKCGTNRACLFCGTNITLQQCVANKTAVSNETTLTVLLNGRRIDREYVVKMRPLYNDSQANLVLVALTDASTKKRNTVYEEQLFTMLLDRLSSIYSACSLISELDDKTSSEVILSMEATLSYILRHVQNSFLLKKAETETLEACIWPLLVNEVLGCIDKTVASESIDDFVIYNKTRAHTTVVADRDLLIAAISELIKNALEYREDKKVVVKVTEQVSSVTFLIQNAAVLDDQSRFQIFQRSYTTKDKKGRGLGTYMARIYVEQVLGGKVGFKSSKEFGTVFFIRLPSGQASAI